MTNNHSAHSSRFRFAVFVLPWISWGLAALFYSNQYFLRVSVSSLSPNLVANFHIDALTIASVAAMFYYAFMVMQIISGVLIDRYGVHIMLTIAALCCALGGFLFAFADNVYVLEASRLLAGAGASFSFIGVITLARAWFSRRSFALVNGLTLTVGTLGAFLGEGPLARLLAIENWRDIIAYVGVFSLLLAVLIWFAVRNRPPYTPRPAESRQTLWTFILQLPAVLTNRHVWTAGIYASFIFVPVAAFLAMWCAPFLRADYHIGLSLAETAASVGFIGLSIGAPLLAWISNTLKKRVPMMTLAALGGFIVMVIILYTRLPLSAVFVLIFLLGIFSSGFTLSFVIVKEFTRAEIAATVFSVTNLLKLLSGAVVLQLIGWSLVKHWSGQHVGHAAIYSLHDFRLSLVLIPVCLAMAFLIGCFIKEPVWREG